MSLIKIILAALVGIPCLVVAILTSPIVAILSIPALALLLFRTQDNNDDEKAARPDQVIIAGGSSGIGLSIAKECVARGIPKITLIARNLERLQQAQIELQAIAGGNDSNNTSISSSRVEVVSVSVADYDALEKVAKDLQIPPTDRVVLWNCAGMAYPGEFLKIPLPKFEEQVMTNQLGTMYLVRAFLPYLHKGCIVLTSSAAGQLGMYGYTTYAPTKYAIRGFAETLHAELIRSHPQLSIQLAFPVDTDTPGYQEELKTSPEITKKLSQTGGIAHPDQTAKSMVKAAFCKNPQFAVYFTLEGWLLSNLTAGMAPVTSLGDAVTQVALSGLFRIIGLFILNDWWNTIRTFPRTTSTTTTQQSPKKVN